MVIDIQMDVKMVAMVIAMEEDVMEEEIIIEDLEVEIIVEVMEVEIIVEVMEVEIIIEIVIVVVEKEKEKITKNYSLQIYLSLLLNKIWKIC